MSDQNKTIAETEPTLDSPELVEAELSSADGTEEALTGDSITEEAIGIAAKEEIPPEYETKLFAAPSQPIAMSLRSQIEAIVFAAQKPMRAHEVLEVLQQDIGIKDVEHILKELVDEFHNRAGGFVLEYITGQGYQFRTIPEAAPLMERQFASRPRPISRAALETLSIIAYRQPVTRADVEYIRGVDAGSIMKHLLERELIKCVGRKPELGRPMLFGTTDEFLKVFRLSDLSELPPIESFQPQSEMVQSALQHLDARSAESAGDLGIDPEAFVGDQDADETDDIEVLSALKELRQATADDESKENDLAQSNERTIEGATVDKNNWENDEEDGVSAADSLDDHDNKQENQKQSSETEADPAEDFDVDTPASDAPPEMDLADGVGVSTGSGAIDPEREG